MVQPPGRTQRPACRLSALFAGQETWKHGNHVPKAPALVLGSHLVLPHRFRVVLEVKLSTNT